MAWRRRLYLGDLAHGAATCTGAWSSIFVRRLLGCFVIWFIAQCGCARKGQERRFELKGRVVSVHAKLRQVTIDHQEIPGYMPAMTMPYELRDDFALRIVKPGDDITATLVVSGASSWLQDAVVVQQTPDKNFPVEEKAIHLPESGEQIPDFLLVNQDGNSLRTSQFRGGPLVITFIYTRCPLPDYCPLMTTNFVELDRRLKSDPRLSSTAHLLSVTIDPEVDTPSVMLRYGSEFTKEADDRSFDRWQFATGTADEVKAIAGFFGLSYWKENGQITHSLVTAVIDSNGKIARVFTGNGWKPDEVLAVEQGL
ncbi:MAG TPA: SCO family protein [Blastocatellia bacterium]|nr:SCO family protein [Blastocatellia bacterium]